MKFLTSLIQKINKYHEIVLEVFNKRINILKKELYIVLEKKTLPIASPNERMCTTARGLQFLMNWFRNKVPHHPASHS